MNFNNHSDLEGKHAFLGASKYHWLGYDQDTVAQVYLNQMAAAYGTRLHALAKELIELRIKLPKSKKSLNEYVNDAIGYRMKPEVVLFYSYNCFGTTDAIAFSKNLLRIHDFKSGSTPASMKQLLIYDALFCLEYGVDPFSIDFENRLYQLDEVTVCNPTGEDIKPIMEKIVEFDKIIESIKAGER